MKTLLVTGTDTGVGKTWVAAALIRALHAAGRRVGAYKPACSGAETDGHGATIWSDVEALRGAVGRPEIPLDAICPQRFLAPLAPPLAARREGREVDRALLTAGLEWWRGKADVIVIEGAGGIQCPMTEDATLADLAAEWKAPAIVVAANRLGTINHTLLTLEALQTRGVPVLGFVLNDVSPDADPESRVDHAREIERRGKARCLAAIGWDQRTVPPELFAATSLSGSDACVSSNCRKGNAMSFRLQPGNYRQQFADFLDRLASDTVEGEEWSSFIVTHYPDEFLEEMRRCTARLETGLLEHKSGSEEARMTLRSWAIAIRSSKTQRDPH